MSEPKVVSVSVPDADLADEVDNKLVIPKEDAKDEEEPIAGLIKSSGLRPGQETAELAIIQSDPNSPLYSKQSFAEMGLRPELLKGVIAMGYNKPSRIQEHAIPAILADPIQHFVGQAQSGTGKTAAFSLSMLSRADPTIQEPQALCVIPTRELARQIEEVVKSLSKYTTLKTMLVLGSTDLKSLSKITAQIVIGTPGRVIDAITHGKLKTAKIKIFVLDEADVMISTQGFQEQTTRIKNKLPKACQICLFSATYADDVAKFAQKIVPDPKVTIKLKPEELSVEKIQQLYIDCGTQQGKYKILSDIYGYISVGSSIIFVHTRETAQNLYNTMKKEGHEISFLTGGKMEHAERDRVLDEFRSGKTRVLITTNVLARGIDILQISLVINFDLPLDAANQADPETYLHRIGRSGRFGRAGIAINFVADEKSRRDLKTISDHFARPITQFQAADIPKLSKMLEDIA